MKTNWIRTSRRQRCPICGKPDGCLIAPDGTAAICMRIESEQRVGDKGAGWLHRLTHDFLPPLREPVRADRPLRPKVDWQARADRYARQLTGDGRKYLSDQIAVGTSALSRQRVGWCPSRSVWTWPMQAADGNVVGIRTRDANGKKRADAGSDGNGLFLGPDLCSEYLLICEGPTDTAALIDCGYLSVAGRPSCRGGSRYVIDIIERLQPTAIVLIPDNDQAGLSGFADLAAAIANAEVISIDHIDAITPPPGISDVRDWAQKSREHLTGRIAATLENIKRRTEGNA